MRQEIADVQLRRADSGIVAVDQPDALADEDLLLVEIAVDDRRGGPWITQARQRSGDASRDVGRRKGGAVGQHGELVPDGVHGKPRRASPSPRPVPACDGRARSATRPPIRLDHGLAQRSTLEVGQDEHALAEIDRKHLGDRGLVRASRERADPLGDPRDPGPSGRASRSRFGPARAREASGGGRACA